MSRNSLSKYFYLDEFLVSETAERVGIDMTPPPAIVDNLSNLCALVLQPLRIALGPVFVTSGYRPLELNRAIGSSDSSQHVAGGAADIRVSGHPPLEVCQWLATNVDYDQLILEFGRWTHVSVPNVGQSSRRHLLTARRVAGKTTYHTGILG